MLGLWLPMALKMEVKLGVGCREGLDFKLGLAFGAGVRVKDGAGDGDGARPWQGLGLDFDLVRSWGRGKIWDRVWR